ncbi:MAG: SDR family oxidoreductase [Microcella sp.]|uniref:SDR family oxidoreductase n=1 Tax=Microcella sp. TaxID=1913979 RepID=UPI0027182F07|nr:SDR family oxidoreductase [Microcella sp.]MDO8338323.1 SDR family oxidoreductase [Microcella sp.]
MSAPQPDGRLDLTAPLRGRRALVTGAGAGIGLACARSLAERGAELVLLGRSSVERGADELRRAGHTVATVTCDLSDVDEAYRVGAELEEGEPIDILVNNAGIIHREPAVRHGREDWQRVIDVNLNSVWALAQTVGSGMVSRGYGRIVTIASLLSFQGGINVVSYATSKHAVVGMTKTLANEWARHGVTVNCVAPGYVRTENTAALRADEDREREIRSRIPAGRWAEPSDIGGAVAFLSGPDAAYVNGHVLVVDGGWLAR